MRLVVRMLPLHGDLYHANSKLIQVYRLFSDGEVRWLEVGGPRSHASLLYTGGNSILPNICVLLGPISYTGWELILIG
jgi:hypothetical protein